MSSVGSFDLPASKIRPSKPQRSALGLPPETFARYQALRGNRPATNGTMQAVVAGPGIGTAVDLSGHTSRETRARRSPPIRWGVYFNPKEFSSVADCLTAASSHGLPLDLCR